MNTILIILLVAAVIATLVALVRGIVAFLQTSKLELEGQEDEDHVTAMQLKQNKMMFARIKFQALAVVIVVILLLLNQ